MTPYTCNFVAEQNGGKSLLLHNNNNNNNNNNNLSMCFESSLVTRFGTTFPPSVHAKLTHTQTAAYTAINVSPAPLTAVSEFVGGVPHVDSD